MAPAERTTKAPTTICLSRLNSMAFRLATYVSRCRLPFTAQGLLPGAGQALLGGLLPARSLQKVFNSRHVRWPPFPSFLTQPFPHPPFLIFLSPFFLSTNHPQDVFQGSTKVHSRFDQGSIKVHSRFSPGLSPPQRPPVSRGKEQKSRAKRIGKKIRRASDENAFTQRHLCHVRSLI